jgi:CheY-like chemotaxis protein
MHALIIEDEPILALDIVDALQQLGYDTWDIAASERQAVARAASRFPDLVIADVRLSEGSGIEAVTTIRRRSPVPVVFATADAAVVRRRLGPENIIEKPFSEAELRLAVKRARQGAARSAVLS